MHYFYLADKDGSETLTKQECKHLLLDTLNAKVSNNDFEKIFKVTNEEILNCCIWFDRKQMKVVKAF